MFVSTTGYLVAMETETLWPNLNPNEPYKYALHVQAFMSSHFFLLQWSHILLSWYRLYLIKITKDHLFVLSERLNQDPLENYFGQQRLRGGKNENPTITQCLQNANAIRVQRSSALDPVRGNCRQKRIRDSSGYVYDN